MTLGGMSLDDVVQASSVIARAMTHLSPEQARAAAADVRAHVPLDATPTLRAFVEGLAERLDEFASDQTEQERSAR